MKKILLFLLPVFLFAEISNDLFRDCSNGNYQSCFKIGSIRMDITSPYYDPSLALDYLNSACNGSVASGCYLLSNYYKSKGEFDRSLYYLKRACELKDAMSCYSYHQKRGL